MIGDEELSTGITTTNHISELLGHPALLCKGHGIQQQADAVQGVHMASAQGCRQGTQEAGVVEDSSDEGCILRRMKDPLGWHDSACLI